MVADEFDHGDGYIIFVGTRYNNEDKVDKKMRKNHQQNDTLEEYQYAENILHSGDDEDHNNVEQKILNRASRNISSFPMTVFTAGSDTPQPAQEKSEDKPKQKEKNKRDKLDTAPFYDLSRH
jgi:hypothetical protein